MLYFIRFTFRQRHQESTQLAAVTRLRVLAGSSYCSYNLLFQINKAIALEERPQNRFISKIADVLGGIKL
ncbi:MAG: hypothetical protein MJA27_15235 [Pseudanabaenales cyanobacterium]|nr:hypothetical protein [Pseudanabaenales cyanobacterium]